MKDSSQMIYDNTFERELDKLICKLDKNPIVCIDPLEDSTYNNIKYVYSEEGFQRDADDLYVKFMNCLTEFVAECHKANAITSLISELTRIHVKYDTALFEFKHSSLLLEWKNLSEHYYVHDADRDFNLKKEQNYTREAFKFFYKMASLQRSFLEKIRNKIKQLLVSNGFDLTLLNQDTPSDKPAEKDKPHFTIIEKIKPKRHNILKRMHKALKEGGCIDCEFKDFKRVFDEKEPHAIVWLRDYIVLTYFIKKITDRFIKRKNKPSNYKIARHCFFDKQYGQMFRTKIDRHQKDPNQADKKIIDEMAREISHWVWH